uniref:Uncharacterized protein n=1 Tax=Pseudomonas phage KV2023 TaxID=3234047 RepID=A0AB39C6T5_9CAUD
MQLHQTFRTSGDSTSWGTSSSTLYPAGS